MRALVLGASFIFTALNPAYACDPNEECGDPVCEARKAVCQGCADIKAAATGASMECVVCVMASTAANPVCVTICGGVAGAERVSGAGNCDDY
jgi:hypothetical protein